jgi:hypothetical protein
LARGKVGRPCLNEGRSQRSVIKKLTADRCPPIAEG